MDSYSGYINDIDRWFKEAGSGGDVWNSLRTRAMRLLQQEDRLQRVVRLVGPDALPDDQRLVLLASEIIKQGFLEQSAFDEVDSYCPMPKQIGMMECILHFYESGAEALKTGMHVVALADLDVVNRLKRMKTDVPNDDLSLLDDIRSEIGEATSKLKKEYT